MVVALGTIMNGVPFMTVVLPESPSGAPASGIVVGAEMMKPCAGPGGSVVGPVMTRNELPSMVVVCPLSPEGTSSIGIVVGPAMTVPCAGAP